LQEDLKPKRIFLLRKTVEMTVQQICHSRGRNPSQWARWEDGTCPAWCVYISVPRNRGRKEGCLTP